MNDDARRGGPVGHGSRRRVRIASALAGLLAASSAWPQGSRPPTATPPAAPAAATPAGVPAPVTLQRAASVSAAGVTDAASAQARIDATASATDTLAARYRDALVRAQQGGGYARELTALVAAQRQTLASLRARQAGFDTTERQLWPLVLKMADTLERFVGADAPFLQQERRERLANLRRFLAAPKPTLAEKYARVIEAYQIELDYGRTLGAERATVENRDADVLRVGRLGLYALRPDRSEALAWNPARRAWEVLDTRFVPALSEAYGQVRENRAPDLLRVPLPTPPVRLPTSAGASTGGGSR